jgi:hypothetical protein
LVHTISGTGDFSFPPSSNRAEPQLLHKVFMDDKSL